MANPNKNMLGVLQIRIIKGINLAVCDAKSSDPFVIVRLDNQKLKTRVVKKSVNPEWNEDLTLRVRDPNETIKFFVYDEDTFTHDDAMGDTEFDIKPLLEAVNMTKEGIPNGTVITKVKPSVENYIVNESHIVWIDGKVTQELSLRLRNTTSGEIELRLQWIDVQGYRVA